MCGHLECGLGDTPRKPRATTVGAPPAHHRRAAAVAALTCEVRTQLARRRAASSRVCGRKAELRRQTARATASGAPSLLAHAPATCARGARVAVQGACVWQRKGSVRRALARGRPACCERRIHWRTRLRHAHAARVSPHRVLAVRVRREHLWAAFTPPVLLWAARTRCWRMHRWRASSARVSPCWVLTIHRRL